MTNLNIIIKKLKFNTIGRGNPGQMRQNIVKGDVYLSVDYKYKLFTIERGISPCFYFLLPEHIAFT